MMNNMTTISTKEQNRSLLDRCELFSAIDEAARSDLAAYAYRRQYGAGEQVFAIGSPGQSMMAVRSGAVRITLPSAGGREIILADLGPGEVFGEISLLDGRERSANAVALSGSELLILERRHILPFLENNPQTCLKLLQVLCGRLRHANDMVGDIAFCDLPKRLARQLLRLGAADKARLACSQVELANMIGASRENVNRCLNDWQRRGIVSLEEGRIAIVEPSALEQLAAP